MRISAIVAEFNPLHEGHVHLLEEVKRAGDPVLVLMSGNFVQRGTPACQDKWTRARQAVEAGADLVLTLPVAFATSPAHDFARGAMGVLTRLPGLGAIYCGGEEVEEGLFKRASNLLRDETSIQEDLRAFLEAGQAYPTALRLALEEVEPALGQVFRPNLILALEYYRALEEVGKEGLLRVLPRLEEKEGKALPSASEIRKGQGQAYFDEEICLDPLLEDRLYGLLRRRGLDGLSGLSAFTGYEEGLENRLLEGLREEASLEGFYRRVGTRRYSRPRISRLLLQYELGLDKERVKALQEAPHLALQVLAMSSSGRAYLSGLRDREDISLVTKFSKKDDLPPSGRQALEEEARASDLYSLLRDETLGADCRARPYVQN